MFKSTRLLFKLRLLLTASFFVTTLLGSLQPTQAVSVSDWQPGNIIVDDKFSSADNMSLTDIQNFLSSKTPTCDTWGTKSYGSATRASYGASKGYPAPYVCLKDYIESPTTHQNNLAGGSVPDGLTSAQIIKNAADTYGVSPKVILVMLQKEQSLVTDDWPWSSQYKSATGYGCPDTAPCDSDYYGFYNQVTNLARQFKLYATQPEKYRYKAFQNNFIQWSPDATCGGVNIYIDDQATADLYNYTPYQPNSAALNNLYGAGDSCSSYGNRNFWRQYSDWFGSTQYEDSLISYKSHVSYIGWMNLINNDGITGTTGQSKSIEAFKINGDVEYSSYNYDTGWQPTINNGMISGTTGMSKHIQAIKINPINSLAAEYDIYYRVHVSYVGWMGWAKNGDPAGVTGNPNNTIEAIEFHLVAKGSSFTGSTDNSFQNASTVNYTPPVSLSITSHVGGIGWQPTVTDTMTSGTTEQDRRIEAIKISLNNITGQTGGITYSAHLAGIGWQDFKSDSEIAGTVGQFRQMEALRIALTGQIADNYTVWYKSYVKLLGWTDWAKDGYPTGSIGVGRQLEAVEVRILPKNSFLSPQQNSLYNPNNLPIPNTYNLDYSVHVSYMGWLNNINQLDIGGTTGQSKPMEAVRINTINSVFGSLAINCSSYVRSTGWTTSAEAGNICGTTGQSKPLEALKLTLEGDAANKYDVYYRTHLSYVGWQDWVKDGVASGLPDSGKSIEAVQIKLVQK